MSVRSFDDRAGEWDDDPAKRDRAERTAAMIRTFVPLDPTTRLLEYGAGTGLLATALGGDVGAVVLADTSQGMRDVIYAKISAGVLPAGARVWDVDLTVGPTPADQFDLIAIVMTLHHIPNANDVLAAFADLLADGGHLCVVDLEAEDGSFHGKDFEGHGGFERHVLSETLEGLGFDEVHFEHLLEIERDTGTYPVFFALARRGPTR
jgi:SAM-dependent methyltransferase